MNGQIEISFFYYTLGTEFTTIFAFQLWTKDFLIIIIIFKFLDFISNIINTWESNGVIPILVCALILTWLFSCICHIIPQISIFSIFSWVDSFLAVFFRMRASFIDAATSKCTSSCILLWVCSYSRHYFIINYYKL